MLRSRSLVAALVAWAVLVFVAPFYQTAGDPRTPAVGLAAAALFLLLAVWSLRIEPARFRRAALGVLGGAAFATFSSGFLYAVADSPPGRWALTLIVFLGAVGIGFFWGVAAPLEDGAAAGVPAVATGPARGMPKVLDTSSIIDGRIADVAESGFLEGKMILPEFVLRELQLIADSSDPVKRTRGRRGLDILKRLRESAQVDFEIRAFTDPVAVAADERAIDARLVRMAKAIGAALVTCDFNLNKVAALQGVPVLNINELANAVKTVLLPGEEIEITLTREGKEPNQGVGYLDDGTMVVVDDAAELVGKKTRIVVTNLHQTSAGRMVFGKRL